MADTSKSGININFGFLFIFLLIASCQPEWVGASAGKVVNSYQKELNNAQ